MKNLNNKVVLITGASGGLGQSVTSEFINAGATVFIAERQSTKNQPKGVQSITADVTNEADVQRLATEVKNRAGRIDGLINLVGGFALGRLYDTHSSDWSKMMTLNLTAPYLLSRAVLSSMMDQGTGRLIHIGARAALEPFPGAAAYIIAKSGLAAMIRVLALELAGTGVNVNGVLPTIIDTPKNRENMPDAEFGKWVKPAAIAQLLVFLASDETNAINGALIPIGST